MSTSAKIWIVIATVLVLLGVALFVTVMSANQWDFSRLSTSKLVSNSHSVSEDFYDLSINTDTAHIVLLPSDDETCKVICYEHEKETHTVTVRDGKLSIGLTDQRKWYEYIGISFGTPKISVYLPKTVYGQLSIKESTGDIELPKDFTFAGIDVTASTGDVKLEASATSAIKIKTSTGDILAEGLSAASLELSVTTGKATVRSVNCVGEVKIHVSTGDTILSDVACGSVTSSGGTGDVSMKNVIATEVFSIKRSTGDVKFENCDATEITVKTDTGSVTGTLLSEKVFITSTDTGRVDVPKSVSGGRCEITTDTGNIRISVVQR